MELENILAKVPGEHVSAALRTLPAAETDTVDESMAEMAVPNLGVVRFYCKRLSARKGKSRHWFWTAERAVVVTPERAGGALY